MLRVLDPTAAIVPPPDGAERWPYVVVSATGKTYCSDSATELVGVAIPDYADIPESAEGNEAAFEARLEFLLELAEAAQADIRAQADEKGVIDYTSEDVLTALFQPRSEPYTGVEWNEDPPLYLIATHYWPFTERPVPTGRVLILDPSTEVTFLHSLSDLGVIQFYVG